MLYCRPSLLFWRGFGLLIFLLWVYPPKAHAEYNNELAVLGAYYQYDEPQIRINAPQLGLDYRGQYTHPSGLGAFVNGRLVYGAAQYNGTGKLSSIPNFYGQAEGLAGWQWQTAIGSLTPMIGLGYRRLYYLANGLSDSGAASYSRTSSYLYLPSKLQWQITTNNGKIYEIMLGFNPLLAGRQESNLQDTIGYNGITRYDNVQNQQKHGWGLDASLAYKTGQWVVRPYWQYWNIGDSDINTTTYCATKNNQNQCETHLLYEPHNITNEVGILLGLRF